eukprot:SAG31_NODE_242_length_19350_cov_3.043998_12_plen_78_part_00
MSLLFGAHYLSRQASGSADHTIKLWELGSDGMGTDCIAVLPGHRGTVRALAYLVSSNCNHNTVCFEIIECQGSPCFV